MFTRYGLRVGIIGANVLNAGSTWIRWVGHPADGFAWVLWGQIVAGISQTLYLSAPPLLSSLWFPANQRATATCVSELYVHNLTAITNRKGLHVC